ncbi:MAG: hypothetical protein ABUT20_40045, partial [Bacteroidota bacterium]
MTIVFTICSNNYLAQAKTFIDSLISFNPNIKPYIFLIDKKTQLIDYTFFIPAELIEVSENIVKGYEELVTKYSIVELNTAVKPFIFEFLAEFESEVRRLYYFDPDICIYDSLNLLDKLLDEFDIIITPHFLSPLPIDGLEPFENLALNYGTYNLGFLALNPRTDNTRKFLKWWGERTLKFGYSKVDQGFFVDQLWFNLVPVFFDKICSLKHPGYNMAAWNLHERSIKSYLADGRIKLNSEDYLAFYHFSSYNFSSPEVLSTKYTRYNFDNKPAVKELYGVYHARVFNNQMERFRNIRCGLP